MPSLRVRWSLMIQSSLIELKSSCTSRRSSRIRVASAATPGFFVRSIPILEIFISESMSLE